MRDGTTRRDSQQANQNAAATNRLFTRRYNVTLLYCIWQTSSVYVVERNSSHNSSQNSSQNSSHNSSHNSSQNSSHNSSRNSSRNSSHNSSRNSSRNSSHINEKNFFEKIFFSVMRRAKKILLSHFEFFSNFLLLAGAHSLLRVCRTNWRSLVN